MIPIGDDKIPNARIPIVNWLLIIINIAVFVFQFQMSNTDGAAFIMKFGAIPQQILSGHNLPSLLSSLFLHGSILHLAGNMLFLFIFGDNIEHVLGHISYLVFYLLGGVIATLLHTVVFPGSEEPVVGASGAISACLGAYLIMFPTNRVRVLVIFFIFLFTTIRISAWLFLGAWMALQIINSVSSTGVGDSHDNIAYWAHIGGFVYGMLIGVFNYGNARNARASTRRAYGRD